MTDKEVERNVRSSTVEGIRTPGQRHMGAVEESHGAQDHDRRQAEKSKRDLLEKFRRREQKRRQESAPEGEPVEPGKPAGGAAGDDT
ncbi:MAG: hypothetical protein V1748_05400 [Actinomycetota bacterium]